MSEASQVKTLSVGIPAYNESGNIRRLLEGILTQQFKRVSLREVIVYSDGSSDETVREAGGVADTRIRVMDVAKRHGANTAQNCLVREASGDILILLNADIVLLNRDCLERLILPLLEQAGAGLSSARVEALPPRSFFERVMAVSHAFKRILYEKLSPQYDTVYLCHGRARAFTRALYTKTVWPDQCPEDGYSYFFCKQEGLCFAYVREACAAFRSPGTFADFQKQSHRFAAGRETLKRYFSPHAVERAYRLPAGPVLRTFLNFLLRYPVVMVWYTISLIGVRLATGGMRTEQSRWNMAQTSKHIE